MTLQQAQQVFRDFEALISDPSTRGARRSPSLLPCPPEALRTAVKLLVAELYYVGAATTERLEPLRKATLAIDSFSDTHFGATEFIASMQSRIREFDEFAEAVAAIGRDHPFFWQRIYPMAGIELQTRRATIFETLRDQLRLGKKKPVPSDPAPRRAYDYAAGRYEID